MKTISKSILTELDKNKLSNLKEETEWSKQLGHEVIEAKTEEICNILKEYFTSAGYDVIKVKYADMWMFEVQVYLSKPNFGEIDIYLDTRFSEFEFGHLKLVDKDTISADEIGGLNKLIQTASNINSNFNLLDIIK